MVFGCSLQHLQWSRREDGDFPCRFLCFLIVVGHFGFQRVRACGWTYPTVNEWFLLKSFHHFPIDGQLNGLNGSVGVFGIDFDGDGVDGEKLV